MSVPAIIPAAGFSVRMGCNKLLMEIDGIPMVRRVVEAALASSAQPVFVVTGNDSQSVCGMLAGLDIRPIENHNYREGLAASIRVGVAAVSQSSDGVLILPGDMPQISANLIDRVIAASHSHSGSAICVACHGGQRGHPVMFGRHYFADLLALSGDVGARSVIARNEAAVREIEADDEAPLIDIDTPAALAAFRASRT